MADFGLEVELFPTNQEQEMGEGDGKDAEPICLTGAS